MELCDGIEWVDNLQQLFNAKNKMFTNGSIRPHRSKKNISIPRTPPLLHAKSSSKTSDFKSQIMGLSWRFDFVSSRSGRGCRLGSDPTGWVVSRWMDKKRPRRSLFPAMQATHTLQGYGSDEKRPKQIPSQWFHSQQRSSDHSKCDLSLECNFCL